LVHREHEPVLDRDALHRQHRRFTGRSLKSLTAATLVELSNVSIRTMGLQNRSTPDRAQTLFCAHGLPAVSSWIPIPKKMSAFSN
jgi:hypothetical protein